VNVRNNTTLPAAIMNAPEIITIINRNIVPRYIQLPLENLSYDDAPDRRAIRSIIT
jgi:hypothetical protein